VYLETPDALVLIDPLAPPDGADDADGFWELLKSDSARTGHPFDVILTLANEWMSHVRSAPEIVDRHPSAGVWAPLGAQEEMLRRTQVVTNWFEPGDALPGGVEAYATALPGEVILWLPEHRALVPGDVIDGTADGGLCVIPDSWLAEGMTAAAQRDALLPLLDLPVELVLVSHGEPVLRNGRAALAQALGV
jgi:glyoxylase-like metal-dependent hydrolase (beta-lactamase superfamily II)